MNALIDFDASANFGAKNSYLEAAATRPGPVAELLRQAARFSAVVRYRQQTSEISFVDPYTDNPEPENNLNADGLRITYGQTVRTFEGDLWESRLINYSFGGEQVVALAETVTHLEKAGIDVVIVEMPVPDRLIALLPGGHSRYRELRKQLHQTVKELGITFIAYDTSFEKDVLFLDYTHFDRSSAEVFSSVVAEAIEQ